MADFIVTGAGAASGAAIAVVRKVLASLLTVARVEAESPTSASDVARGFWQCLGAVLVLGASGAARRSHDTACALAKRLRWV